MPIQTDRTIETSVPAATEITTAVTVRELICPRTGLSPVATPRVGFPTDFASGPRAGGKSSFAHPVGQHFQLLSRAQGDESVVG